ncbi:MAG: hypothetical protein C5B60_07570 [Chloroflexi bacterium]|nr:MAG: hypothetical protein C5B60_07570 [Chloroflexota bacterium]
MYVAIAEWYGSSSYELLNKIGPSVLLLTCLACSYLLVKINALVIWSPLPWFLATCAIYFGFGPLAYYFSTPESIDFMNLIFFVDDGAILRTNVLNSLAIAIVCVMVSLTMMILPPVSLMTTLYKHRMTKQVMWGFLIVGGLVQYCFSLPFALGWLSWTLPGSIQHLSGLLGSAIIILFVVIDHGDTRYQWLLYLLVGSELVCGLLMLSKLAVILTMLMSVLGFFLVKPKVNALIASGIGIALLYSLVLSPFVLFARQLIGGPSTKEAAELRLAANEYRDAMKNDAALVMPGVQAWWTRLSYANAQAFAMDAYDSGASGQTFGLLPYVFVPRVIFTNKPFMTTGTEFASLMLGHEEDSAIGPGFFGEAYWNGGWGALILACVYLGVLFTVFARFGIRLMASHQYWYLPVIVIGIITGLRPDDWFVPTAVGGIVEAIFFYWILRGIKLLCQESFPLPPPAQSTSHSCAGF